jgi:hypothetical protein
VTLAAKTDNTETLRKLVHILEDDPIYIAENVLGVKEHDPWQIEFIESVWDAKRYLKGKPTKFNHEGKTKITVRSGHGTGKTFSLAEIIHLWLFGHKVFMPCLATAPKQDTLKSRLFPTLRKIKSLAIPEYQNLIDIGILKMTIAGDPDWAIQGETATVAENLAGYHDDYMLVVIDEASGVSEEMYPVLDGAVSTGIIPIQILISNPTKTEGTFWASHCKNNVSQDYYQIHVSPEKSSRISKKWIRSMMNKYGESSPVVKVRCLGEFANMIPGQLIDYAWLEYARFRDWEPDGSFPFRRLSIDVADGGEDETVFTLAEHYDTFIVFLKGWRKSFPPAESPVLTYEFGKEIFDEYCKGSDDDLVIDGIGVGSGTVGLFIKNEYPVIRYIAGSTENVDTSVYKNLRTKSHIKWRNMLRDKEVIFDKEFWPNENDWDDFVGQACSIKTKESTSEERIEELEPKRKLLKSPDLSDSASQQFCDQSPSLPIEIKNTYVSQGNMNDYDAGLT